MSQTPPPNDPYGTEPGAPAPHGAEPGSPTSDPALHPHDPFAYDDSTRQAPAPQAQQPPAPQPSAPQPSAGTYDAPAGGCAAPGAAGASAERPLPYGAPHTAPAGDGPDQPLRHQGRVRGPLSVNRSAVRTRAMGAVLAARGGARPRGQLGFLGWVGPLIIFMMYKDRDRSSASTPRRRERCDRRGHRRRARHPDHHLRRRHPRLRLRAVPAGGAAGWSS